jgi:hypothetical protein
MGFGTLKAACLAAGLAVAAMGQEAQAPASS